MAVHLCQIIFAHGEYFSYLAENEIRSYSIPFPNQSKSIAIPAKSVYNKSVSKINLAVSPQSLKSQSLPNSPNIVKSEDLISDEANTPINLPSDDLPKDFNPFSEENENQNELLPDVLEEVAKFRAKLASNQISTPVLSSNEENIQESGFENLSIHCLLEILRFLNSCISIINDDNIPQSEKFSHSIRTQQTALKCLNIIFSDPSSLLFSSKTLNNLNCSRNRALVSEFIKNDLLKNILALLTFDPSARHLSSLSQILILIFSNFRFEVSAQFEFFLFSTFNIIASKSSSSFTAPKSMPKMALSALKICCLEMLAYVPTFIISLRCFYLFLVSSRSFFHLSHIHKL
jgi:hypothetical protein